MAQSHTNIFGHNNGVEIAFHRLLTKIVGPQISQIKTPWTILFGTKLQAQSIGNDLSQKRH